MENTPVWNEYLWKHISIISQSENYLNCVDRGVPGKRLDVRQTLNTEAWLLPWSLWAVQTSRSTHGSQRRTVCHGTVPPSARRRQRLDKEKHTCVTQAPISTSSQQWRVTSRGDMAVMPSATTPHTTSWPGSTYHCVKGRRARGEHWLSVSYAREAEGNSPCIKSSVSGMCGNSLWKVLLCFKKLCR